ncbi:MAG: MoaD/ThiS family protein [Planctomycetota bacterium]|nr:MoaD/ThiS family protein [Planctomycetota bacterium]
MKITIQYGGPLRPAAGVDEEGLDLESGASVAQAVAAAAGRHAKLRELVLDSSGAIRPSLLVFVNDEQVREHDQTPLSNGDELTIMAPISGG